MMVRTSNAQVHLIGEFVVGETFHQLEHLDRFAQLQIDEQTLVVVTFGAHVV